MAITVLEIIPGRMKHGSFTKDDLRPLEVSGDAEARLLSQMAAWTLVKNEETSLRHEDMGDYDYDAEVTRTSLLDLTQECIVAHGGLIGLLHSGIIFFTDGKKPLGDAEYSSSYENGRSTYYTKTKYSLIKENGVTVLNGVVYKKKDANPYHTVHFVPRTLGNVELHPDTEEIEANAFENNKALERILLPDKLTYIADKAFMGCTALKEVRLSDGLRGIGSEAFKDCSALEKVHLAEGLTLIKSRAFESCTRLSEISLPASVENIWGHAFAYCKSLKRVKLSSGMKEISGDLFRGCTALETVDIPEGVEEIGIDAFKDCASLYTVKLPITLKRLDIRGFSGCESLVEIIAEHPLSLYNGIRDVPAEAWGKQIHSGESLVGEENGFLFLAKDEPLLLGYRGCHTEITLPEACAGKKYTIKAAAFQNSGVVSLTVPDGMTVLSEYAFSSCDTLEAVVLPCGMTEIPKGLFYRCVKLEKVTLPEGLLTIGEDAFARCDLRSLTVPDSVTTVGKSAFSCCSSLREVKLGVGVKTLEVGCFYGCSALPSIVIPEGVETIGDAAFKGCLSLKEVKLPTTLTKMGHSVFQECTALTALPEGLTAVTSWMFQDCTALVTAEIPEGVRKLGYRAFAGCCKLKTVTIPASLQCIEGKVFLNCKNLYEVHVAERNGWYSSFQNPLSAANYFRQNHDTERTMGFVH